MSVSTGVFYDSLIAGYSSTTISWAAAQIGSILAGLSADPVTHVFLNWGVNEMSAMPSEATWIADYTTVLDAVHTKWPDAKCYVMRPWKRGYDSEAATIHGWIDTLVAARSSFAYVGPDEAVWLKGSDDGATNTSDGVHYSAAGKVAASRAWLSLWGY